MAECILLKSGGGTGSDDCTATKANVLAGVTAVTKDSGDEAAAGTMANKGAWTSRIGVNGKAVIPAGYHNGSGYVDQAITNRGAVNASLGINGTYAIPEGYHNGSGKVTQSIATMGAQTVTPGSSQKVISCSGKYMTGNITVPAVSNLVAQYIKKGVNVGGVVGTWDGYVANPTDLYYKGVNSLGFTSRLNQGRIVFETAQISLELPRMNDSLITGATRNFAGYNTLTIEGRFKTGGYYTSNIIKVTIKTSNTSYVIGSYFPGHKTSFNSVSFSLAPYQVSGTLEIFMQDLTTCDDGAPSRITRIRLS